MIVLQQLTIVLYSSISGSAPDSEKQRSV